MSEQEYLLERIEHQIRWYSYKANANKYLNIWIRSLVIISAASLSVITQLEISPTVKNLTVTIVGATIAILTGVSGIMKFQEKWTKYRTAAETMKHEKFLFKTRSGVYASTADPFKEFVPRVESLISKENSFWNEYVNKSN